MNQAAMNENEKYQQPHYRFSSIREIPREEINELPEVFQGRDTLFSEETVEKIVSEGYDKSRAAIVLWTDENGKHFIISGHSRWEASKRLFANGDTSLATMPVKFFLGSREEAVDFALIESNRGGTPEGLKSDIAAYKRAIEQGYNKDYLRNQFRPPDRLEALRLYSNLNLNGLFIQYLDSTSRDSFPYLVRNAKWVGQMRLQNPTLTDAHETELFRFLYPTDGNGGTNRLKIKKDQFFDLVNKKVSRIDFDPEQALNLQNSVSTNALTDHIAEEIAELEAKIKKAEATHSAKNKKIVEAREKGWKSFVKRFEDDQKKLNILIRQWLEEIANLRQKKGMIERTAVDLFSQEDKPHPESSAPPPTLTEQTDREEPVQESPAPVEPPTVQGPADTLALLQGGTFFRQHPEKVLGELYETKDQWGKTVIRVAGDLDVAVAGDPVFSATPKHTFEAAKKHLTNLDEWLATDSAEKHLDRAIAASRNEIGAQEVRRRLGQQDKCPSGLSCFAEVLTQYNQGISESEIEAWVWYKLQTGGFNDPDRIRAEDNGWSRYVVSDEELPSKLEQWRKEGVVCCYGKSFMPAVLYFAENIYVREEKLLKDREHIVSNYGQGQYDWQMEQLLAVRPRPLNVTDAEVENRLFISPIANFSKHFEIKHLADGKQFQRRAERGAPLKDVSLTLNEAFRVWLGKLPSQDFKESTADKIIEYFLDNVRPQAHLLTKQQIDREIQFARKEGYEKFSRFLAEGLVPEDQERLEYKWNSIYNGYVAINYFRVPVAFTCSETFKNKPLFIRPAQREALGFFAVHGSGCLAYDVGVGKTMPGILSLALAMESGQCKRPLVVVPNATYKKWMDEIGGMEKNGVLHLTGLLPQYKLNHLYNLGHDFQEALRDENGAIGPVDDYSISVITMEGFNKLGFSDQTLTLIGEELVEILNQGNEGGRAAAKTKEKIKKLMGKGSKGAEVTVEELGFDFILVDEAHSAKKSFTSVKGELRMEDDEVVGRKKSVYSITAGVASMTALRAFMLSFYIHRHNHGRNVELLTATPFTNSPMEIYSMLALVGYHRLHEMGINNIRQFFDTFARLSIELVMTHQLRPVRKEIMLGFNNLVALQQLVFRFFLYKTGEDAGIQRPTKWVLPRFNETDENGQLIPLPEEEQISTILPMTPLQATLMKDVEMYVRGKLKLGQLCKAASEAAPKPPEGSDLVALDEIMQADGINWDEQELDPNVDADEAAKIEEEEEELDEQDKDSARALRGMTYARQIALSPYLYSCYQNKKPTAEQYIASSPKLTFTMQAIATVVETAQRLSVPIPGQIIYMNAGVHFFPLIKQYLVNHLGFKPEQIGIVVGGMDKDEKDRVKADFLAGKIKVLIGSASIREGIDLQNKTTDLYHLWVDWNPTDQKQLEGRHYRYGNEYANVRVTIPLMENSMDIFIFQKLEEKTSRINEVWSRPGHTNTLPLEELNPHELKMALVTDPVVLAELMLADQREKIEDEILSFQNHKEALKEISYARDTFNRKMPEVEKVVDKYKPPTPGSGQRQVRTVFAIYREFLADDSIPASSKNATLFNDVREAWNLMQRGQTQVLDSLGLDLHFDQHEAVQAIDRKIESKNELKERLTGEVAVRKQAEKIQAEKEARSIKSATIEERVEEFAALNEMVLTEKMVYRDTSADDPQIIRLKPLPKPPESAGAVSDDTVLAEPVAPTYPPDNFTQIDHEELDPLEEQQRLIVAFKKMAKTLEDIKGLNGEAA